MQFEVRAVSQGGAIMTFGLESEDFQHAQEAMASRLPFVPWSSLVMEVLNASNRYRPPEDKLESH